MRISAPTGAWECNFLPFWQIMTGVLFSLFPLEDIKKKILLVFGFRRYLSYVKKIPQKSNGAVLCFIALESITRCWRGKRGGVVEQGGEAGKWYRGEESLRRRRRIVLSALFTGRQSFPSVLILNSAGIREYIPISFSNPSQFPSSGN